MDVINRPVDLFPPTLLLGDLADFDHREVTFKRRSSGSIGGSNLVGDGVHASSGAVFSSGRTGALSIDTGLLARFASRNATKRCCAPARGLGMYSAFSSLVRRSKVYPTTSVSASARGKRPPFREGG